MSNTVTTQVFVVRDNIDTDQIIPAQYLTLVPTIAEEYEKLGTYAMAGLPDSIYPIRLVPEGEIKSKYGIIVGGRNFGCGSSREHAPLSIKASGVSAVVARSFARIFYRNSVNLGLPVIRCADLHDAVQDGDEVVADTEHGTIVAGGRTFQGEAPSAVARRISEAGSLVELIKNHGWAAIEEVV